MNLLKLPYQILVVLIIVTGVIICGIGGLLLALADLMVSPEWVFPAERS